MCIKYIYKHIIGLIRLIIIDDTAKVYEILINLSFIFDDCVLFLICFLFMPLVRCMCDKSSFSRKLLHLLRKWKQLGVHMLISDRYRFSSNCLTPITRWEFPTLSHHWFIIVFISCGAFRCVLCLMCFLQMYAKITFLYYVMFDYNVSANHNGKIISTEMVTLSRWHQSPM